MVPNNFFWHFLPLAAALLACHGIPADRSAASESSNKGGTAIYYEYNTHLPESKAGKITSSRKIYVSSDGNARLEQVTSINGKAYQQIISITRSDRPGFSILLNPDQQTYSLLAIDDLRSLENSANMNWQVTKIGSENVMGYNCCHSKTKLTISITKSVGSVTESDVWTSTEVPGFATLSAMQKKILSKGDQESDQLKKAGCDGMLVRFEAKGKGGLTIEELTVAEHRSFPASLFEIPPGFKEEK